MPLDSLEKIIILGHSGFIGKSLYNFFKSENNFQVTGATRNSCNLLDSSAVKHFFSTIEDYSNIIFCSVLNKNFCDSTASLHKNIAMVDNFINCARQKQIRSIIYLSSVDVYGQKPQLPINEKTLINPDNVYGLSKFSCEFLLKSSSLNCPIAILRLPGIYGNDDNFKSIVGHFIKKIYFDNHIFLSDKGKILRDYVEINDLCQIIRILIANPNSLTLNIATGKSFSLNELVDIITEKLRKKINIKYKENLKNSAKNLVFDNSSFFNVFPDFHFTNLKKGCSKYVDNFLNQIKD